MRYQNSYDCLFVYPLCSRPDSYRELSGPLSSLVVKHRSLTTKDHERRHEGRQSINGKYKSRPGFDRGGFLILTVAP